MTAEETSANVVRMPTNDPVAIGAALATNNGGPADGLSTDEHLIHLMEAFEQARQGRGAHTRVDVAEKYPTVDWAELWNKADEEVEWLCEPLLRAGHCTALFSQAKEGKSLLSIDIAGALSTGRSALGNPARAPIDVLYVDFENSEDDLLQRLIDLGYGPEDLVRLHYLSFPNLPALNTAEGGAELLAAAEFYNAKLVIIDTVGRSVDGDEDKSSTYNGLYRHTIMPLKKAGTAVLRLDHAGKDVDKGQRGSSGKNDDVDAVWKLTTRPGSFVDLTCTHGRSRHQGTGTVRHLVRLKNPLRHARTGQAAAPDVEEVVALLDKLDVPIDWGRDKVRARLIEVGQGRGTDLLALAIKVRKERFDLSRTGAEADDAQQTLRVCQDSERTGR